MTWHGLFTVTRLRIIMTAFLLAELTGEPEAVKALLPQNVAFPGVKYETNAPARRLSAN